MVVEAHAIDTRSEWRCASDAVQKSPIEASDSLQSHISSSTDARC